MPQALCEPLVTIYHWSCGQRMRRLDSITDPMDLNLSKLWEVEASLVAQIVRNLPGTQRPWFNSSVGKIPWRRECLSTPVFLLENSMDRGPWWATVHGIAKSWTRLSDYHEQGLVKDRGNRHAAVHGIPRNQTRYGDWTATYSQTTFSESETALHINLKKMQLGKLLQLCMRHSRQLTDIKC